MDLAIAASLILANFFEPKDPPALSFYFSSPLILLPRYMIFWLLIVKIFYIIQYHNILYILPCLYVGISLRLLLNLLPHRFPLYLVYIFLFILIITYIYFRIVGHYLFCFFIFVTNFHHPFRNSCFKAFR